MPLSFNILCGQPFHLHKKAYYTFLNELELENCTSCLSIFDCIVVNHNNMLYKIYYYYFGNIINVIYPHICCVYAICKVALEMHSKLINVVACLHACSDQSCTVRSDSSGVIIHVRFYKDWINLLKILNCFYFMLSLKMKLFYNARFSLVFFPHSNLNLLGQQTTSLKIWTTPQKFKLKK